MMMFFQKVFLGIPKRCLTISSVSLTPAKITTKRFPKDTVNNQAAMIQDFIEGGDWKYIS